MQETQSNYGITTKTSGELAASASAAQSKALVEAKFVMAAHRPRSHMQVRAAILEACKRPKFAERAWYAKPVGKKKEGNQWVQNFVRGPSIRFAEEAIRAMTNIAVIPTILHEDAEKRIIYIDVIDLESNTSYGDTVTVTKTIERKDATGRDVIGDRLNSYGDKVFIVLATEEEITVKMNAAKSKIIRNSGLRLVPQDLIEEAEEVVAQTLDGGGDDRILKLKKMVDAFGELGVKPADIEGWLGHSIDSCAPIEQKTLRGIYAAIKDGEAKWSDYVDKDTAPATDGNDTGSKTNGRKNRKPPGELQDPAQHRAAGTEAQAQAELIPATKESPTAKDEVEKRLNADKIDDTIFVEWVAERLDKSEKDKYFADLKPETFASALESWDDFLKFIGRKK